MTEPPFRDLGRPGDDEYLPLAEALLRQEASVCDADSPVAALILAAVREDLLTHGPLSARLPDHVRFGDMVGLRIMATVHRLALERRAPAVAMHLPTLGGLAPRDVDESAFRAAVVECLVAHPDELRIGLASTPQTNETGRAALLRAALSRLDPQSPVRLFEIGASAGLNLRADHLPGVPGLESGPLPPVVERLGCDLAPIDPSTTAGRVTLTSYVWVDDVARFEALRHALEVAARVPAVVRQQDAGDFVESLDLQDHATTVLWHSAMWLYLPQSTKTRVLASLQSLGSSATPTAQLAHASWEWTPNPDDMTVPFELVLRRWRGGSDDGVPRLLARGHGHGKRLIRED